MSCEIYTPYTGAVDILLIDCCLMLITSAILMTGTRLQTINYVSKNSGLFYGRTVTFLFS